MIRHRLRACQTTIAQAMKRAPTASASCSNSSQNVQAASSAALQTTRRRASTARGKSLNSASLAVLVSSVYVLLSAVVTKTAPQARSVALDNAFHEKNSQSSNRQAT